MECKDCKYFESKNKTDIYLCKKCRENDVDARQKKMQLFVHK